MKKESKTVRQLLAEKNRAVVSVRPSDTVLSALKAMADNDIGAVLVIEADKLVGIFSERDYARQGELSGRAAKDTTVRDVMTTRVVYVTPERTADDCLALMHDKRFRHLPVLDAERVVGVLSSKDVLEEVISEEEHLIRDLEHDVLNMTIDTGGSY